MDVMLDLETLGVTPGCSILSIGAVVVDWKNGGVGREFYMVANRWSCCGIGLFEEPATAEWWKGQSEEAREVIREADDPKSTPIREVLVQFGLWLKFVREEGEYLDVWGNGSDFDNAILATAYYKANLPQPWDFWCNRCYRTVKRLRPDVEIGEREGVFHNALDDAKNQARHLTRVMAALIHGF